MTKQIILILFTVLLLAWACTNPFATRSDKVEQPDFQTPNSGFIYDPAIEPGIVFDNFKKAMTQKNIEKYMETLIGNDPQAPHTFRYEPEPHFKSEFTNQKWLITDERNYFTQLTKSEKDDYPKLSFSFVDTTISLRPITPASVNDSVESSSLKYRLEVFYSFDSSNVYEGFSRFKLYRSTTPPETWHIYYWQDNAIENNYNSSWTFLKLFIRKQSNS